MLAEDSDNGRRRRFLGAALFYNSLILVLLPWVLLFIAVQWIFRGKYRGNLLSRMGHIPAEIRHPDSQKLVFWIHAVSVGEVMAASPLVRELRRCYPGSVIFVSTVTETGQLTASREISDADQVIYFPFDLPWAVRRMIRRIRPSVFLCLETEIWPNFLFSLARHNIPAVWVNGRISQRAFLGYRVLAPFFQRVLSTVTLFSVQTRQDEKRLVDLGVDPRRVVRTGNLKYDQVCMNPRGNPRALEMTLKLPVPCELILGGSTHEGEEDLLASCYLKLLKQRPQVRLLLAPRHLERLGSIRRRLEQMKLNTVTKTEIHAKGFSEVPPDTVILLDTLGELQEHYAVATLVFVGGSLVPVGGHNVLEPAACSKPVLFGPHMENFHEIVELLIHRRAALQVANVQELLIQMEMLLVDPQRCREMGHRAGMVVSDQQGIVDKNLVLIRKILSTSDA